jgi:hypothetical protein
MLRRKQKPVKEPSDFWFFVLLIGFCLLAVVIVGPQQGVNSQQRWSQHAN